MEVADGILEFNPLPRLTIAIGVIKKWNGLRFSLVIEGLRQSVTQVWILGKSVNENGEGLVVADPAKRGINMNPHSRIGLMFFPIGIPGPLYGIMYIAYSFYASRRGPSGINHAAHLSGAFIGLILTLLFFPGIGKEFVEMVM